MDWIRVYGDERYRVPVMARQAWLFGSSPTLNWATDGVRCGGVGRRSRLYLGVPCVRRTWTSRTCREAGRYVRLEAAAGSNRRLSVCELEVWGVYDDGAVMLCAVYYRV